LERVGKEIPALSSAIEELSIFVDPKKMIATADVQALLGKSLQEDVFTLMDRLLEKKMPEALEALENLLHDGTSPSEIIAVLGGQWARLASYSEMKEQGRGQTDIAAELKIHPFFQEKFFFQAAKTDPGQAESALRGLMDCDQRSSRDG